MIKIFEYKKGQCWDGDELIYHFIEDGILEHHKAGDFPTIKKDCIIEVRIKWKN